MRSLLNSRWKNYLLTCHHCGNVWKSSRYITVMEISRSTFLEFLLTLCELDVAQRCCATCFEKNAFSRTRSYISGFKYTRSYYFLSLTFLLLFLFCGPGKYNVMQPCLFPPVGLTFFAFRIGNNVQEYLSHIIHICNMLFSANGSLLMSIGRPLRYVPDCLNIFFHMSDVSSLIVHKDFALLLLVLSWFWLQTASLIWNARSNI